jgi:pimeloyl-ACP methyl ester carboxylesterase
MYLRVDDFDTYAYTGSRPLVTAQPTVLFVHGAAHDHSVWALQSRYFAHHGFNVLAVDLPGHGRSAGRPLASIEAIADWLPRVLDAAGVATTAVVGHSMGSLAALACAARHGDRVGKVALLGPAVPMLVSDALLAAAHADDHLAFELINGWSHSAGKQLGGNQVPGMWMTGAAMRLMERSGRGVLHNDLKVCAGYTDGLAAAAAVRCPALVIMGARDVMAPPRGAQALLAALAQPAVVTLPDTGHALMAEQPDAVLDALRRFL